METRFMPEAPGLIRYASGKGRRRAGPATVPARRPSVTEQL